MTGCPVAPKCVSSVEFSRQSKMPPGASVLTLGNTGGAATPYQQAVDVAANLEDGHLLTLDATGHVGSGRSACVDDASTAYLIDLTLPEEGTTCEE